MLTPEREGAEEMRDHLHVLGVYKPRRADECLALLTDSDE